MKRALMTLLLCGSMLWMMTGCSTLSVLVENSATATPAPTAQPTAVPTAVPSETPAAQATPSPEAVPEGEIVLTEENYKTIFEAISGYSLVGRAYFKAPRHIGGFADAFVPSGTLSHELNGYAVRGAASGLSVFVTLVDVDAGEDAREALDELADDYLDTLEVDDDAVQLLEVQYEPDYDLALRPMFYTAPDGSMRFGVLYADTRGDGDYLGAAILYMPEQEDENTAALLTELSDAYGLTLPSMD